jgi:putative membrane protein
LCAVVTDPRTLQANERTLLAWLRTGASLITLGFAIAKLGQWLRESGNHSNPTSVAEVIGGAFVFLGAISEFLALKRYHAIRKALLAGGDVQMATAAVTTIVVTVAIIGLVLAFYVFIHPFQSLWS